MGILCSVILPATCVVPPRNTEFAQRRAVGSELVGHDDSWSDSLLLQKFSHELQPPPCGLAGLERGCPKPRFAVHSAPDIGLIQGKGNRIRIGSRQRDCDPRARPRKWHINWSWGRQRLRWNYFGLLNRLGRRIGCYAA